MYSSNPGAQGSFVARSDVGVDELVDLDNFLDKYLSQLQAQQAGQANAQPGFSLADAAAGAGLRGSLPVRPVVTSTTGMSEGFMQQGGMLQYQQPNFKAGNMLSGGLGRGVSGGPLTGPSVGASQVGVPGNSQAGVSAGMQTGPNLLNNFRQQPGGFPASFSFLNSQLQPPTGGNVLSAATGSGSPPGPAGRGPKKNTSRKSLGAAPSPDDDDSSGLSNSSDDDEPKSRKKREVGVDEVERRHLALQEKNRRAQRRFRERQKTKIQELHKQIEELTSKVSNLQTENVALQSRTSILEKVLDMRNEQIQVMQESKEVPGLDDNELQGMSGHLVHLTPDVIKELSSDQIYKIYQTYVKELSLRLVEVNRAQESNSALQQEVDQLCKDLCVIIMRLGVIKPLETRKFIVVSRQYLGTTESEVIDMWSQIMKNIDLVDQQKKDIVELKRMFLTKIEPIMEERKNLNMQIQAYLPHDTFHTKNALAYIKAHEAVIKLRENLRAEQHVVMEFAMAVFRGVFKPHQMATVLVQAYPAVPDALGIASAMALELGEQLPANARQIAGSLTVTPGGSYIPLHSGMLPGTLAANTAAPLPGPAWNPATDSCLQGKLPLGIGLRAVGASEDDVSSATQGMTGITGSHPNQSPTGSSSSQAQAGHM